VFQANPLVCGKRNGELHVFKPLHIESERNHLVKAIKMAAGGVVDIDFQIMTRDSLKQLPGCSKGETSTIFMPWPQGLPRL
jgi:hypothetical protein